MPNSYGMLKPLVELGCQRLTQAGKQDWLYERALDILDAAVDAIITIDADGTIQTVNAATLSLFGYIEEQLVGAPVAVLIPEPHRDLHQAYIQRYLATGQAKIIGIGRELLAQRKDGTNFPMSLAISEIKSGTSVYFAGIVRDLTEQKAAQHTANEQRERLAQVGRLSTMGEMTASIAHEINQPLTAISMYAQASLRLLGQEPVATDKLSDALEKLNAQSLRAGAVIERIQRFVRNESGQREPVDLNQLIGELSVLVAADARLHGIELEFTLDDNLPSVFCDPIQIQQVAINLIRNAIDAMDGIRCANGNIITISSSQIDKSGVHLSVQDCGTGVADDQRSSLFTAFHTTKISGMGLGLAICRSIVESHNGTLSFENNAANGCTFYFTLPLDNESA